MKPLSITNKPINSWQQPICQRPIKIIQFGEGNFLRAFVDYFVQKMNEMQLFNGAVAVVQPMPNGLLPLLEKQNFQYTHFMKGMKEGVPTSEHYVNQAIQMGVNPYTDFQAYLQLAHIESADIIVSNTTEAGIEFRQEDVFQDVTKMSYPGKLTCLFYERYKHFNGDMGKGYLLLPCELIDQNADALKAAVLSYVDLWALGDDFKRWCIEANQFCNTLVDRIVPGFPKETISQVWELLGVEDQLVVESEQFHLWVIEGDEAVAKRFPAHLAGCQVLFVPDVTPYKMRKVRILNGAHTTLVPIAYLSGIETVGEAMAHEQVRDFLNQAVYEEIMPTLALPPEELATFASDVMDRFRNPYVKHYLMSIALNSLSKFQTRLLPSVLQYVHQKQQLPKRLVASLAATMVFYRGQYVGKVIQLSDSPDILALFEGQWSAYDAGTKPLSQVVESVLSYETLWKMDLNQIPGLSERLCQNIETILESGMTKLLGQLAGDQ